MRFACRNFGVSDLPRRGLTPSEAPLEVLLLDIDAELSVRDDEGRLLSEEMFPVAELAYWPMHWLQSPDAGGRDFELDSMSADRGLIWIVRSEEGWRVGSNLEPGVRTSPVAWDLLVDEIRRFVHCVREGVELAGPGPRLGRREHMSDIVQAIAGRTLPSADPGPDPGTADVNTKPRRDPRRLAPYLARAR
ncbi:DUF7878 domain-containing protein [Streptomyces laculatispora]|uniref:DUF7878 domain-containing protein n=1 Tax=Streptomyces laculatispora TaxID=887464 RepID=UPI003FD7AFBC